MANTTMNIPNELVSQVEKLLENCAIDTGKQMVMEQNIETQEQSVVKEVVGFRKISGYIEWNIKFIDGKEEWIKDECTDCEASISKYRAKTNIPTNFLISRVSTKKQGGPLGSLDAQVDEMIKVQKEEERCSREKE